MSSFFGKPHKDPELEKALAQQREESRKTLETIKAVLDKKDQLLAEAFNQTGQAIRRKPRRRLHPTRGG